MWSNSTVLFSVLVIGIGLWIGPKSSLLLLIDFGLAILNRLDEVEKFNTKDPNYVDGNWAPIHKELDGVKVTGLGHIPENLIDGMYVRNGANPKCWPPSDRVKNHAFGGEAMLQRIEIIGNQEIKYSNSYVRGDHMDMNKWKPDQICNYGVAFGDRIDGGSYLLWRLQLLNWKIKLLDIKLPVFEKSQPGSTSVVKHAHRTITCTESWLPYEIRIKRNGVQSIGFTDLDGLLKQESGPKYAAFSAHPIIDPETEEMFFFSRNGGPGAMPRILYGSMFGNGTPQAHFQIPVEKTPVAFVHDLFLTEKYVVVIEGSLRLDSMRRWKQGKGMTFFDESRNLRFGVLPRENPTVDKVIWVTTDSPGYAWHTISAWDNDDGTISAFMPKFDKYNDNVDIHLSTEQPSFLTKFTIDLKTKIATQKRLMNLVVERPSYNTGVLARNIAYLRSEGESSRVMGKEIVKYDLKNEKILGSYQCKSECIFGEAFFVSSSGKIRGKSVSGKEDDGYLVDIVYHPETHSSSFVMINATTMEETFMAPLPQRVPFGVHGIWFDKEYLDEP